MAQNGCDRDRQCDKICILILNGPFIFRFEMNNSEVCVYRDIT